MHWKFEKKLRKIQAYARGATRLLTYKGIYRSQLARKLDQVTPGNRAALLERVNLCNQVDTPFTLSDKAVRLREIPFWKNTSYYFDLLSTMRYFDAGYRMDYEYGDVVRVLDVPTLVKSRPITDANQNNILLKWVRLRHYPRIRDDIPFREKQDRLVWRGWSNAFSPIRERMLATWFDHPLCDVGKTNHAPDGADDRYRKGFLSIAEHLQYKFLLSIEGFDVATNLKWIAQSNSLCLMPKPTCETWFLESRLEPSVHYVQVRDDFADLVEKVEYYRDHADEAEAIIANFQRYVRPFYDPRSEELLELLVALKYFQRSGQCDLEFDFRA